MSRLADIGTAGTTPSGHGSVTTPLPTLTHVTPGADHPNPAALAGGGALGAGERANVTSDAMSPPEPAPPHLHPPIAAPLGEVTTERLTLHRCRESDLDDLAQVFAKVDVWRYPFGRGFTRDETEAFLEAQLAEWDTCGFGLWVARERASGRTLGFVGLSVPRFLPEILPAVEVGWRFDPDVWGRGYATEGATAALTAAFTTLQLDEVCSVPQAENTASVRVAERLGMRLARPVVIPPDDRRGRVDALLYVITPDAWQARTRRSPVR